MKRRRTIRTIVLATALAVTVTACENRYEAAGVIVFAESDGRTVVLLADHVDSDRGWGTFGGHRETGESVAAAASRELREETRCIYELTERSLFGAPSVARGKFLSYVVEVPFVEARAFAGDTLSASCRGESFDERGPWAWIPLDALVEALDAGDSTGSFVLPANLVPPGSTGRLWDESARVLQLAVARGYLDGRAAWGARE